MQRLSTSLEYLRRLRWLLSAGAVIFLAACGWYGLNVLSWDESFRNQPPQTIFREVIGMPVPIGVSHLRVAARSYVIKRWAWMRFQATDTAIAALTKQEAIEEPENFQFVLQGKEWVANPKFNDIDRKEVGWQDVFAIDNPEVYRLSTNRSPKTSWLWQGEIIVDRKNHAVYIYAGGD